MRLMLKQSLGLLYRNYKLNKLMILIVIFFLITEYYSLTTQTQYPSITILVTQMAFFITFQSVIVINLTNDRANGFLDLYASMGLLKTPYILCQLFSFSVFALFMQICIYLLYFIYHGQLDSLLPGKESLLVYFYNSLLFNFQL